MRTQNETNQLLSVSEAAEKLNVSEATLRNWVRCSVIRAAAKSPLRLRAEEVEDFISSGAARRLRTRANRTLSGEIFPLRGGARPLFEDLRNMVRSGEIELEKLLFACVRRQFRGDARTCVRRELENWRIGSLERRYERMAGRFAAGELGETTIDMLYAALSGTGTRSGNGRFFTSGAALSRSVALTGSVPEGELVLDPACGGGSLLLALAEKHRLRPEQLCGMDIDPVAVRLAAGNLLNAFRNAEFAPRIVCGDSLKEDFGRRFPLVFANPPWGTQKRGAKEDSFAAFLRRSTEQLAPGGRGVFILPEAFLNIRKHEDIRLFMLERTLLRAVIRLGRCFPGVFSPAAALSFDMPGGEGRPRNGRVAMFGADGQRQTNPAWSRLRKRRAFPPERTVSEEKILRKIRRHPHFTLKDGAKWALGVVTGNNKKFLVPGGERAIAGRNIEPFFIRGEARFDLTAGKVQQMAPEELYRSSKKLVYRFIGGRLVFAVDREGRFTLNSANIVIPDREKIPLRIEVLAALLNSAPMQFYYEKECGELKILRRNLETLPLPRLTKEQHNRIFDLTAAFCRGTLTGSKLDEYIVSLYGLDDAERKHVMRFSRLGDKS